MAPSELQRTQNDLKRIVKNRAAFYEIMSDMIILVRPDHIIEDMNASAIRTLGDLRGRDCYDILHDGVERCHAGCPIRLAQSGQGNNELLEKQLGDIFVEFNFIPFDGYHGDQLVMLVMRDVSKRKRHELELAEFNNNIEKVLKQKIADLNESEKFRSQLVREISILKKELSRAQQPDEMIGESKPIRALREMIYQVADTNATVLITGESGTGKELVADLLHKHSSLNNKHYLKFNCAAVSENLLESDLFGYEKGAFTGAVSCRKGKFEIADGGTIFLDEIGDISPKMQSALLRVLQNGEIIRVGGSQPITVNVRIIAATNADLMQAVEDGTFRKDLFYRLNVINLHLVPLRERKEDILPLTTHFVKKYRQAFKKDIEFLPDNLIDALLQHDWPGNIRELENVLQRAVLLSKDNTLAVEHLKIIPNTAAYTTRHSAENVVAITESMLQQPLKQSLGILEKKIITQAIKKYEGRVQEAAKQLDLGKTALYSKMKRYNISAKDLK